MMKLLKAQMTKYFKMTPEEREILREVEKQSFLQQAEILARYEGQRKAKLVYNQVSKQHD